MNPRESFTLCPSRAFCSNGDNGGKENCVIPGTIRRDWKTGDVRRFEINPEAGLGIRAAPFEPSVNDRNLPTSGTISPLNFEEYQAWIQTRQGKPVVGVLSRTRDLLLAEHPYLVDENGEDAWKLRYLQSEMSKTQSRMAVMHLLDERRRMRIQMLELEAQLHEARTNRQQSVCRTLSGLEVAEERQEVEADDSNNEAKDPVDEDKVGNDTEDKREEPEEGPTVTQNKGPSAIMIGSRLRSKEANSKDNDATISVSPKRKTAADDSAVEVDEEESNTPTKRKWDSQKAGPVETDTFEGEKTSSGPTRSKRKCNVEGNEVADE